MAGAIMAALFALCCSALVFTPRFESKHRGSGVLRAIKGVIGDLRAMLKTKGGTLSAVLCALPIGTGAAQGVLTQATVAGRWGAGAHEVELIQGLFAGLVTAIGCFAGGWLCQRFHPRTAYVGIGLVLAAIAAGMAVCPATVTMYVVWNLIYSFGVGIAYAAFTAVVLNAMGAGSGATKYNVYASLSNFPIWWLGLALGLTADKWGARMMLLTEAGFAVLGVLLFAVVVRRVRRSVVLSD
jgi:MFS-type transporter involved in bile tolerance (Atg22 family)